MRQWERMRNTQCITKCYLGYLCYSHEVEKTERLRSQQGKNKYKKTTSCNTDLCVTQGRLILIFSWVLSGYQFLPFWKKLRMRGVTLKYGSYSHSIVPTGLGVRSMSTRLIPSTSLVIRAVILWRTLQGISSIVALIASFVLTARMIAGQPS